MNRLLLVDDDAAFRQVYASLLRSAGYTVDEADDRPSARARLGATAYPVVLLDLMLPPDGSARAGVEQLRETLASHPNAKVIIASGVGNVPLMLDCVRAGAYDFLTKPVNPNVLLIVVERALSRATLEDQVGALRETLDQARPADGMIGQSPSFLAAVDLAQRVARADLPVLVTGDSGTGKELLARAIHDASPRRDRPFVVVNCAGLPETLLDSSMFGHVRGAFTGATRDRKGLFAEAHTGTIFLDEIGDMPVSLQVKLLRTLESGEILPVGADRPVHVDVRVLSATNRDLLAAQRDGAFREDLYWRIRGAEVHLPPLRERPDDVPLLARHFLNRAAQLSHDGRPKVLSPGAVERLVQHDWTGNLRELRHEMRRATVLAGAQGEIQAADLELRAGAASLTNGAGPGASLSDKVETLERAEIARALRASEGNRTHAADSLGLSRQGLLKKMGRYGLG